MYSYFVAKLIKTKPWAVSSILLVVTRYKLTAVVAGAISDLLGRSKYSTDYIHILLVIHFGTSICAAVFPLQKYLSESEYPVRLGQAMCATSAATDEPEYPDEVFCGPCHGKRHLFTNHLLSS